MKTILFNPVLNLIIFTFVFNAAWEWIQSPFFIDITSDLNTIIMYRIHCTLGDTLLLLSGYGLIAIYYRDLSWIHYSTQRHYVILTLAGILYTLLSEHINVHIKHNWSYSRYMPLLPGINIGLVPLLQWIILPSVILFVTKRQCRHKN